MRGERNSIQPWKRNLYQQVCTWIVVKRRFQMWYIQLQLILHSPIKWVDLNWAHERLWLTKDQMNKCSDGKLHATVTPLDHFYFMCRNIVKTNNTFNGHSGDIWYAFNCMHFTALFDHFSISSSPMSVKTSNKHIYYLFGKRNRRRPRE